MLSYEWALACCALAKTVSILRYSRKQITVHWKIVKRESMSIVLQAAGSRYQ